MTIYYVMHIIFDEREVGLHQRCLLLCADESLTLSHQVLPIGDIIFTLTDINEPLVIMERKTIPDLLSSIKDGRYVEQSYSLTHASGISTHRILYLIEGMVHMQKEKNTIYSAITSLNCLKGFSVLRTMNIQETSELVIGMGQKLGKETNKGTTLAFTAVTPAVTDTIPPIPPYSSVVKRVKKDNVTPENMFEIMLCQIPGVSTILSNVVATHCQSMDRMITMLKENSHCLDQLTYECKGKQKKVNSASINNIRVYMLYTREDLE